MNNVAGVGTVLPSASVAHGSGDQNSIPVGSDGGAWTVVRNNGSKSPLTSAAAVGLSSKDQPRRRIIGSNKVTGAKISSASVGQWHVFIGRVDKNTDEDAIKDFLEFNNISVLEVRKLKAMQPWQEKSSAFHVSVSLKCKDDIMNADLWPDNVEVRDWVFKPKP